MSWEGRCPHEQSAGWSVGRRLSGSSAVVAGCRGTADQRCTVIYEEICGTLAGPFAGDENRCAHVAFRRRFGLVCEAVEEIGAGALPGSGVPGCACEREYQPPCHFEGSGDGVRLVEGAAGKVARRCSFSISVARQSISAKMSLRWRCGCPVTVPTIGRRSNERS